MGLFLKHQQNIWVVLFFLWYEADMSAREFQCCFFVVGKDKLADTSCSLTFLKETVGDGGGFMGPMPTSGIFFCCQFFFFFFFFFFLNILYRS